MTSILHDEQAVTKACLESKSQTEVLLSLGLSVGGKHIYMLEEAAKRYGLTIPKARSNANEARSYRLSDEQVFCVGKRQSTAIIRKRLVGEGRELICAWCGIADEWNGKPITLQVDHVDGDATNNLRENLRFLCPNCHSQTSTFCSRKNVVRKKKSEMICKCGNPISSWKYSGCRDCRVWEPKKDWPPLEELAAVIRQGGLKAGYEYVGCAPSSLREHLKKMGTSVTLIRTGKDFQRIQSSSTITPMIE